MVCTIPASAWTWLVRPREASVATMNGAGLDAGGGNPGSVIILQKRLGVGTAIVASSVGRGWVSALPVSGWPYDRWQPGCQRCMSLYSGCCRSSVPGYPYGLPCRRTPPPHPSSLRKVFVSVSIGEKKKKKGEMAPVQLRPQATVAPGSAGGSPSSSTSLYVGELDLRVTDAQLYDVFSQIGQVVSARVCRDVYTCRSLGYGYVNFTDAADAARALEVRNFMLPNGKIIHAMSSNSAPIMRKSGTGSIFIKNLDKSINNRLLHDTFSVFVIAWIFVFGFQQSLVPGKSRHGTAAPSANFCMPMAGEGGQQAKGFGARGAGGGPVQRQQLLPMPGVQQASFLNIYLWFSDFLEPPDTLIKVHSGVVFFFFTSSAFAGRFIYLFIYCFFQMLGEKLYPLVDQLEHGHAAQVTGMLLEMDQTQVLHLLESPEDLKAKVAEAVGVLRGVTQFAAPPPPS
ncbi:hypothetical protein BHE74_00049034 [Ensete ventricosum]|nr:hypothetical protein BHE74_00049034 [Ensete ventricosum]